MNSRSAQQNTTPEHDDTSRPDQSPPSERWRFEDGKPVLVGSRCGHCGKVTFPFEGTCDRCLEADPEAFELPREGQLYSFTVVHTAPTFRTTCASLHSSDQTRHLSRQVIRLSWTSRRSAFSGTALRLRVTSSDRWGLRSHEQPDIHRWSWNGALRQVAGPVD
jgi:hypothetical protein